MDYKSNIIKYDELVIIQEGIKQKLQKKIKNYKLLFKASRDGYKVKDFHSKCDYYDNTVTFVKTNIGRRFGGFTDQKWDQSGSYKSGSYGFLFSLDLKEICGLNIKVMKKLVLWPHLVFTRIMKH